MSSRWDKVYQMSFASMYPHYVKKAEAKGRTKAELVIIAAIWLKYREKANPFLVAAGFIVAQMLAMGLLADNALLESLLTSLGQVPSLIVWLAGFAIGAATSWAGWNAGKRPAAAIGAAQAA